MPTYRTAPDLAKPPRPEALTRAARRAREHAAEVFGRAAERRTWKGDARAAAPLEVRGGPHPRPVERIALETLTGSAKSLAKYAAGLGLRVLAASNGRDVEVRVGRPDPELGGAATCEGRVVFRGGRLVHAFALIDGSMRKRTLTALKASLAEAAA